MYKRLITFIVLIISLYSLKLYSQTIPDGPYLGQTLPNSTAERFAYEIISKDGRGEERITFSPDGTEIFFGIHSMDYQNFRIMRMVNNNNKWSEPDTSDLFGEGNVLSPVFSPSGDKLFFKSGNSKISFIEKLSDGWSSLIQLDQVINFSENVGHPSVTFDGTLYFIVNVTSGDNNAHTENKIYVAKLNNNNYTTPQLLSDVINNNQSAVYDPFIASDESYMIFAANFLGGSGLGDLFISFKNQDGSWSNPWNLGNKINSNNWDYAPTVSPDGKYLFFTRWGPSSNPDIFWVDAGFIDSLKQTITGVDEKIKTYPQGFHLYQNYPNPFNPATVISYELQTSGNLELIIYNTLGQRVKTLTDSYYNAGKYSVNWNGTDDFNNLVSSGAYFYELKSREYRVLKKMLFVK